jgi:FAD/FMN-containing dehydrogenase
MQPFSDGSEYLNFPGSLEKDEEILRRTFGTKYARLVELKNTYDPTNLFRLNVNIQPTR